MRVDWCRFSLFDYVMNVKLHKGVFFKKLHNRKLVRKLDGYDFIIAHSRECGELAKMAKERYGTPYSVTWHGSDIHSEPLLYILSVSYVFGLDNQEKFAIKEFVHAKIKSFR